mgnify:CR=1 FL=1
MNENDESQEVLMKKVVAVVMGLALVVAFASSGHAYMRRDMGLVKGKVVTNDASHKALVVDGERGEGQVRFDISEAQVTTSTRVGDRVVVIYKRDTGKATWVKEVPPGR